MTPYDKMKRVFGLTQEGVAAAVQVPITIVRRWEAGTACPSAAQWRDLAVLCGTSVPELLNSHNADAPSTILTARQVCGSAETFWGYLALWLSGAPHPVSYPVTARTAEQVRRRLEMDGAASDDWLVVSTLDNRMLLVPVDVIKSVELQEYSLSDAPDVAACGRSVPGLYAGEIYRALADHFDAAPDAYEAGTSLQLRRQIDALVQAWGLHDVARRDGLLRRATVHFRDGSVMQEAIDHPECCWSVADADAVDARWVVLGEEQRARHVLRDTVQRIELPKMRFDAQVLRVVNAAGES